MSADNYYYVCQDPETGRWHALMGFASDEGIEPPRLHYLARWFETELDAIHYAMGEYSEYGVNSGPWLNWEARFVSCPTCDGDGEICIANGVRVDPWDYAKAES